METNTEMQWGFLMWCLNVCVPCNVANSALVDLQESCNMIIYIFAFK
jgi:hypothetical protein